VEHFGGTCVAKKKSKLSGFVLGLLWADAFIITLLAPTPFQAVI